MAHTVPGTRNHQGRWWDPPPGCRWCDPSRWSASADRPGTGIPTPSACQASPRQPDPTEAMNLLAV
jgi:hypothetical protein